MRVQGIDLSQTWSEASLWVKVWFVLGAIALVGGISWDRVVMQRAADDFLARFPHQCAATDGLGPDDESARAAYCACVRNGLTAEYGSGRLLARQSRYWDVATYREMGQERGCE